MNNKGSRINRTGLSREENQRILQAYWQRNLRLTLTLIAIWFIAGYLVAIILAPWLNRFTFLGGPLGFWFAQNGAILIFWILILIYVIGMNRLDKTFDVQE